MATDRAKITAIALLAAKVETTTGTLISVLAADAKFIVNNLRMVPDQPENEREQPGGMGQAPSVVGLGTATLTFDVEVTGNGGTGQPPWATTLLPACGYENTAGTFSASNNILTTLSLYRYSDGLVEAMTGCKGNCVIRKQAGQPGKASFTFRGKYTQESDTAILSPTFPTVIPPVDPSILTFGAFSPKASFVEIDFGNQVEIREDLNSTGGVYAAEIVNRKPTWAADPEAAATASRDWQALRNASTQEAFSLQIGASANNTIIIASAASQVVRTRMSDRNGLYTRDVGGRFNGLAPLTIAFS